MASQFLLIDRVALRQVLQRSFDAATAETLLEALEQAAGQVHAAGIPREEFLDSKAFLSGLAEAHLATEQALRDLAEAQRRADQRMEELAEAQRRTSESLSDLAATVRRFETRMERFEDKLSKVVGRTLEMEYRDKAHAYFGRWLRRPRVVDFGEVWDALEARLSATEFDEVRVLDLIVSGRPRLQPEVGEVWLAVEVSAVVDTGDTGRALRRAQLLQQAGLQAIPVAAGQVVVPEAEQEARVGRIAMLQDGSAANWEEALAAWVMAEKGS